MTQMEHHIIAGVILVALWYTVLKHYFVTEKNVSDWDNFFSYEEYDR